MKKEIISKLVKAGHITFEEGLILMETEKEYVYTPTLIPTAPYPYITPINPLPQYPWGTAVSTPNPPFIIIHE